MKLSIVTSRLFALASFFVSSVLCQEADECTQGLYDPSSCDTEDIPYLCAGRFEDYGQGVCISEGLCCCESRDGLFASSCRDGDICCDGGCCDPKKSFCCGGGCCEMDSEVCCNGECVGKSSTGIRVVVPVILSIVLALLGYCLVVKAPRDLRMGRLATFMALMTIFGVVQVVVALSSWDCSTGVTVLLAIGAAEAGLGLLFVLVRLIRAKASGEGFLAAFTLERIVIVVVDTAGKILGVAVADERTAQAAKVKLGNETSAGTVPRIRA